MGSNRAISRIFLLILSVTLSKITAERKYNRQKKQVKKNEIGQKQSSQAVQKELPKVIHFQKFLKIGNNDVRVLLLVKFHVLIQK